MKDLHEFACEKLNDFRIAWRKNVLLCVFNCGFLLLFAILWVAAFFFPNSDLIEYNVALTMVYAAGFCGVLFLTNTLCGRLPQKCFVMRHSTLTVAIFLICLLPLQGILLFNVYFQPGWDVTILTESGYWLATNRGVPPDLHSYFASYPNNITLLMLWAYFFKILIQVFGYYDYLFAAIMLGAVLINLALFVVYRISARWWGRKCGLLTVICGVPLLCFAPWLTTPYSDTIGIVFPIVALDLFDISTRTTKRIPRYALAILAGVCTGVGAMIKPTAVIVLIAIGLGWLLCIRTKQTICVVGALVLCMTLSCVVVAKAISLVGTEVMERTGVSAEYVEQVRFPMTHFLMMGMQKQTSPFLENRYQYGKWYADDVNLTFAQVGQQAKIKANFEKIGERLQTFGVLGYSKFLFDKARWVLGDGTMYFGGEIDIIPTCFQQTPFAQALQNLYWRGGALYNAVLAHFLQGVWMVVLGFCAIPIFRRISGEFATEITIARMAVLGIFSFVLLFEGRARYIIPFLPLFLLLAAFGCKKRSKPNVLNVKK